MPPRRTRSQVIILDALRASGRALSAQELFLELRQRQTPLGLATVYRTLDSLRINGEVQARALPSGELVYSLVQQDQHYLTCLHCGASIQINCCPVQHLEAELQQSYHFEIFYHTLEFFGLCAKCQVTVQR
ncbi:MULTISPECIES: Fur family transcriptional regulator [unclassified Thermosynechococcus]|uniref:Fur family transcriptional regulator n=1 Tax=unclassified Thermosynechococcus TaxID=2622553 RepID=UPI001980733D|nr:MULTISPECIES: Fur family transcriptional regulator [unclassified Thermosynechococcus]MDR5639770.1 Fur family transcriptional regulator [Thermosynechococcus sp. PP42]MDR7898955.1 Fur family transcriptional regulator [Thermosynechococcus sp. JY1332]MDR7906360.1 Fur family transcriptional regulator [Thermosynechococcus sp. JY1334]MDR7921300.1 Fur family transcriptional regulator [Thermosynechococcus sp. HY213]MDR7994179.1 Fur family transcriptional regulator [Thermosynechococcus sp. TG252]